MGNVITSVKNFYSLFIVFWEKKKTLKKNFFFTVSVDRDKKIKTIFCSLSDQCGSNKNK